jgi:predicted membrane protein
MNNTNQLSQAKTLTFAGAIVAIVISLLWILTFVGIIITIINIVSGILFLKFKNFSDQEFIAHRSRILFFGIFYLLTSFLGGILLLIAYFTSNVEVPQQSNMANLSDLEKANELKEKGVLTDEEFKQIKNKSLNQ